MIDPRARQILFDAYWSGRGWKSPRDEPNPDDFAYAKSQGVMFDRETLTHDGAVRRSVEARHRVEVLSLADALMASLESRQVHFRPGLASYYALQGLEIHRFSGRPHCSVCGQFERWDHDFSATNFARIKWGAVARYFVVDHAFTLERFSIEPRPSASDKDRALMHQLLAVADAMPADARARDLEQAWRPLIRSSRHERDELIEILVACGVLAPSRRTEKDFERIPLRANWSDEAALWRGDDGVSRSQASTLFGFHRP